MGHTQIFHTIDFPATTWEGKVDREEEIGGGWVVEIERSCWGGRKSKGGKEIETEAEEFI